MSCGIVEVTKNLLQLNLAVQPKSKDMLSKLSSKEQSTKTVLGLFLFGLDKQNQISIFSVFDKVFETHYVSIFHEISMVLTSSAVAKTQWNHMICKGEFLVVETTEF